MIDGQEMVKGRFTLTRYNLRDTIPSLHATDASIVAGLRDLYSTLRKGSVGARAMLRITHRGQDSGLVPGTRAERVDSGVRRRG